MIRKIFTRLLALIVFLLTIYLMQGASYRMIEKYAKFRLHMAWGQPESGKINPILSKLPLDHFRSPPQVADASFDDFSQEDEYARKIMSFARPLRDRYSDYCLSQNDSLSSYEIVDLEMARALVKPGLRRPATALDVERGLARRIGMPIEHSRGLVIFLETELTRPVYQERFARLENTFGFLLSHGLACLLLEVSDSNELSTLLEQLKSNHPNLAEKLFVCAQGESASILLEAFKQAPGLFHGLVVDSPARAVVAPQRNFHAWILSLCPPHQDQLISRQRELLRWASKARESHFLYPSRLGGLLMFKSPSEKLSLSSHAVAFLLECMDYFERMGPISEQELLALDSLVPDPSLSGIFGPETDPVHGVEVSEAEPNFECRVISEYRMMHADNVDIAGVSNRELVLRLGASFEAMGGDALDQVALKDPLFYRYYLSLKEITD